MSQPDNTNYVRRVVLPSGRAIEVVYFENQPAHAVDAAPGTTPEHTDLHVCPECDKHLVYPVEWSEASPTSGCASAVAAPRSPATPSSGS